MPLPETVTSGDLGRVLGIGDRQVQILAKTGVLSKVRRGRYDLAGSVRGYLEHRIATEVKRATPDSADDEFKRERARGLRINNDIKERSLIPLEDAMAAIDAVAGIVPTELQGIAPHVADDAEGQQRAETYVDGVLNRLRDRALKACAALETGGDPLDADEEDDG